jgi:nitroimidazol reductase NimA-like FMN-containing flavoprotein (pyridoxamine 5'-phosphate oxidase superfamily)
MSLAMTRAEREEFLAETHVGILSVTQPGRAPLAVPVWYDYEPGGEVRIVTGGASRKVPLLRQVGHASLCVQLEAPPYRYVTVEGPVTIGRPEYERDVRQVALRYLGERMGEAYLQGTVVEHESALLLMLRPERWMSADFRKWGL